MSAETFVSVGGGLAAARAVEAVRDGGHQGPRILVGSETTAPTLIVSDRGERSYDRLLTATGSSPRRLDLPGADLGNALCLRPMNQATTCATGSGPGARS